MDIKLKKELERLMKIGKKKGELRTATIEQLLNDLGMYTDQSYEEALEYIENDEDIFLIVDNQEPKKKVLDSNKIAIVSKTLSVEAIVKRLKNDEINLDTEFQRKKSLWDKIVKSQLIESLKISVFFVTFYL